MPVIKSYAVGNGDMFYIQHFGDSFTIIDCDLSLENADVIIKDLKQASTGKTIRRFICTHPDEDHFGGIEMLDDAMPIVNFYVVKNKAIKENDTTSFTRYRELRDSSRAFYLEKACSRRWLNDDGEGRKGAGIQIQWPDTKNRHFVEALQACNEGKSFNNTSAVVRYSVNGGASFMWLGDLETEFMEKITGDIKLMPTTIVFASHHGRRSGKIPNAWLDKIRPKIIVIGEAPSRDLHYYSGYQKITQNLSGDITMDCQGNKVHFYVSETNYEPPSCLKNEGQSKFINYIGSLTI